MASSSTSIDVELLLDRLLSASTPTDCLDSLEQLQKQCRYRRPPTTTTTAAAAGQKRDEAKEAEAAAKQKEEEERHSTAVDTVLRNVSVLHALCSLVSSSTLPSQHATTGTSSTGGMEVEGGDVAACELLLELLPSPPPSNNVTGGSAGAGGNKNGAGMTTEALQKQRQQRRRTEYISKTLLHYHESSDNNKDLPMDSSSSGTEVKLALTPSLLDCLCASPSDIGSTTAPTPSVYARVLSLQILSSLLSASPGALKDQLMNAPEGVNRLVDLLGHSSMGGEPTAAASVPEEVRNEAILFLTSLASSSSMLARLITFSEGYDRALKIALESGKGLSSGSTIAMDCLELCLALAHADDVARELFLGGGDGRGNLDRLAQLVDLRGGERYRDKERNVWWEKELKEKKRRKDSGKKSVNGKKDEAKMTSGEAKEGGRKRRGKKSKDDNDDLDDILRGASTPSTTTATGSKKTDGASDKLQQSKPIVPEGPPTPYLTPNETKIVQSVLDLLLVLLHDGDNSTSTSRSSPTDASRTKRRGRAKTIASHDLSRYVVDCALYTLPPPGVDYVSAVPPPRLQQKALVAVAALGSLGDTIISQEEMAKNSKDDKDDKAAALRKKEKEEETQIQTHLLFETMPIYLHGRVTAIDRLMYLCCTGAYVPNHPGEYDEDEERPEVVASLLSTYSISAFRSCLPSETASRMVLHALAPPPPDETDASGMPLEPPVVTRLVTTLADNLRFLQSTRQHHLDHPEEDVEMTDVYRATIGASGSAGALGVFLMGGEGDATREMLLRLAPPPPRMPMPVEGEDPAKVVPSVESEPANLIDFILQHVATYDPSEDETNEELNASSAYIACTLLKLLCEWVTGMPRAVAEVLSSPSSVAVGVLLRSKRKSKDNKVGPAEAAPGLSGMLLGLCLEYMTDSDINNAAAGASSGDSPDMENSAWTKETIMNMIQSVGLNKYLAALDEYKRRPLPLPYCGGEERSGAERRAFAAWYGANVALVRRRVVATLAGSGGGDESDESDSEDVSGKPEKSLRSLRKMVSSQANEMEELQSRLDEALLTISSQSTQIKELKRVAELSGTSTETNDAISEYTEKMAELERTKIELKKEAEERAKSQQEAFEAKDKEVEAVKQKFEKELQDAQDQVEEMRRDNEVLSEEMAGLSAAYNSLEQQYHRSTSSGSLGGGEMTAGGETAAEDGGMRNQQESVPGGEAAAENQDRGTNNHEILSLREENARLREEGRAANEWMQMAVSKMEEMSVENESLARSLEEARTSAAPAASSSGEDPSEAIRSELEALRIEAQRAREESEANLKAKEDELAQRQEQVQQLENQLEKMKLAAGPSTTNEEELKQELASQRGELESLRKANKDAQEWMASAVTHVDTLTKEVQEKDEKLAKLQSERSDNDTTPKSDESDAKIADLKNSLKDITSERDELQSNLAKVNGEMSILQEENEDLRKTAENSQKEISSEKEALKAELDKIKAENVALSSGLAARAEDSSEKQALKVELDQVKTENATLSSGLAEFKSWSETAQSHLAEVEAKLQETATERDELRTRLETTESDNRSSSKEDIERIESLQKEILEKNEQLERMRELSSADKNDHIEKGELEAELEKLKEENATLSSGLAEFKSWSETAQIHLAEVETKLQETSKERDELKIQLETVSASENKPSSEEDVDRIKSLQEEIWEKNEQLERMQDQLIEDADENEAKMDKMLEDLEAEKKHAEDLSQEGKKLSSLIDKLSLEKEQLSSSLSEKQSEIDLLNASKDDANMLMKEAQQRISELEVAKSAAEAQVDKLMALESDGGENLDDQIISITAERNELQSQLDDINEELVEMEQSLDRTRMENGNLSARNRALEQDNKSLEYQLNEKDNLLASVDKERSTLQSAMDEMKSSREGTEQSWQEQNQMLQVQLQQKEKEAAEAIAQLEAKCSALEGSGEEVTNQWAERVKSLEADVLSLETQLAQQEQEAAEAIAEWEARCSGLEGSGEEVINQWAERVKSLEADVLSLETQLEQQETEAAEAISEWEKRCSALEGSGEEVISQWAERVKSLEADVLSLETQLEQQEQDAADAISEWEKRCSALEGGGEEVIHQWELRVKSLEEDILSLESQLQQEKDAEEILQSMKAKSTSLENQIGEKENIIVALNEEKASLQSALDEMEINSNETVKLWQDRVHSLEDNVAALTKQLEEQEKDAAEAIAQWESNCSSLEEDAKTLESQLEQQQQEAAEAIALWESRCSILEDSGDDAIRQWEETVQSLQAEIEQKEREYSDAQSVTKSEVETISMQNTDLQGKIDSMTLQIETLKKESEENFQAIESMQLQLKDKEESLASSDDQVSELAKELLETQNQSEQVVKQWQERSQQLESSIHDLESTIQEHEEREKEAADAISLWEARCLTLNEKIEVLDQQLVASEKDTTVAELKKEVVDVTAKLAAKEAAIKKSQEDLNEARESLAKNVREWKEKEALFTLTTEELKSTCSEHQKKSDEAISSLNSLKDRLSVLKDENATLEQERKGALRESEESQIVVLELKEELRHAKEELQSFATDQFTVKATEMATQALRQQMVEIRSQYAFDKEALTTEKEARRMAEEEVHRLKSDLALLAQATEYNEDVDVHVRKIAKKVSAENVKAERKEMEELRSALERLREELGACHWKERESEEKASNARLQMSILEQEVSAAKTDLALMEQAMEDLETSKIEASVALEYRIQALENDRLLAEESYEEEIFGIKAELAQANQEKDNLTHKLEQSEKANAALVYSTSHDGPNGEESESEVIKLQLERAQLLAKINEMGADLERRVREAVAAQASSSEAELIVEKQSRKSVISSLTDAISELEELKTQMAEQASKYGSGDFADKELELQDLEETLEDIRITNGELENKNKLLQAKLDTSDKENRSTINDLKKKLQKAEERLRAEERETRFEAAMAAEIANLRASSHTTSNGNQKQSQALVLRGIDQNIIKDTAESNSAYIIEMYDYVCDLKKSIAEERIMYKDLLAEHEDLLALLGQTGIDGVQFNE